jgi:hypothetical protein
MERWIYRRTTPTQLQLFSANHCLCGLWPKLSEIWVRIYKSSSSTGYYHREIHAVIFSTELSDPELRHNSVSVTDNVSYHNVEQKTSDHLCQPERIHFSEGMLKPETYLLIKASVPRSRIYFHWEPITSNWSWTTRFLPPLHPSPPQPEFNLIELIWQSLNELFFWRMWSSVTCFLSKQWLIIG